MSKLDLFEEWILSLLNEETPQALETLQENGGYCCLGDLLRVSLDYVPQVSCKVSADYGGSVFSYENREEESTLPLGFVTDNVVSLISRKVKILDSKGFSLLREGMVLRPADLNDRAIPKPIIGLFIWSMCKDDEVATRVREVYPDYFMTSGLIKSSTKKAIKASGFPLSDELASLMGLLKAELIRRRKEDV